MTQSTFGYRRAELIGAMIQLTALIIVGLYLTYEACHRFFNPEPLLGGWIMAAAGVALVVSVATAWLLWAMSKGSLNVKAAFLHNLTDAGASVAVLLGGAAIYWLELGRSPADTGDCRIYTLDVVGHVTPDEFDFNGGNSRRDRYRSGSSGNRGLRRSH